jgi:predicted secreted hydrolase
MFYALRGRDGRRDPYSAGTWLASNGHSRALRNEEVQIEALQQWRVRVPSLNLDLDVRPLLADQELNTSPRYWEGAVSVESRAARGTNIGRGYVELVGYADAH